MSKRLEELARLMQNGAQSEWDEYIPPFGRVPMNANLVRRYDGITTAVWYRDGDLQVQLVMIPPWSIIGEHGHSNIDSFEMYIGGDLVFSRDGYWVVEDDDIVPENPTPEGANPRSGNIIRIHPGQLHGGVVGPNGGIFMSIQQWLNGVEPSCVGDDYDGIPVGNDHISNIKISNNLQVIGNGTQEELTWRHAATKETTPPPWIRNTY